MRVNDYVRTKDGCIAKFEGINESFYEFDNIIMDESTAVRDELFVDIVEKSSPNIIDLISYGDIVKYKINNEIFISEVWGDKNKYFITNFDIMIDLKDLDIKSIVTKEQFESMEYKVKE